MCVLSSRFAHFFEVFFGFVIGIELGVRDHHRMENQKQLSHAGALGGHLA